MTAPGQDFSAGTGEPNDPYWIANARDLITLGRTPAVYDRHFRLMADINLWPNTFKRAIIAPATNSAGLGFRDTPFSGVFDGNDCVIRNLVIEGGDRLGLFGLLAHSAVIRDLGCQDCSIRGSGAYVGSLAGESYGAILNCHSTGTVTGYFLVGGLAGDNFGRVVLCYGGGAVTGSGSSIQVGGLLGRNLEGSVSRSYSTGAVAGPYYIGGLVGANCGSTLHCWTSGTVVGRTYVGGLPGESLYGVLLHCYSTGSVVGEENVGGLIGDDSESNVVSCFWDMERSGLAISDGGMGLTTAAMQDMNTFLNAGWDFVGETGNGVEDLWWIDDGQDYPHLWWEQEF